MSLRNVYKLLCSIYLCMYLTWYSADHEQNVVNCYHLVVNKTRNRTEWNGMEKVNKTRDGTAESAQRTPTHPWPTVRPRKLFVHTERLFSSKRQTSLYQRIYIYTRTKRDAIADYSVQWWWRSVLQFYYLLLPSRRLFIIILARNLELFYLENIAIIINNIFWEIKVVILLD